MESSQLTLFVFAEVALVLLLVCVGLLFYVRGLKALVRLLEGKVLSLRKTLRITKQEAVEKVVEAQQQVAAQGYLGYLDHQIRETELYHHHLEPDRDIVLDLESAAPPERQAASFRHAVLIAEKEALLASEDTQPVWSILQHKFQRLIRFYQDEPRSCDEGAQEEKEEHLQVLQSVVEEQKERIRQLEQSKHQQEHLLAQWDKTRELLQKRNAGGVDDSALQPATKTIMVDRREELEQLRARSREQERLINDLKGRLQQARTAEQKLALMDELQTQVSQQQRFLSESDMCIQQLEQELEARDRQVEKLEQEVLSLSRNLAMMEEQLASGSDEGESAQLRQRLADVQQELLNLRAQHFELEERYVELFDKHAG